MTPKCLCPPGTIYITIFSAPLGLRALNFKPSWGAPHDVGLEHCVCFVIVFASRWFRVYFLVCPCVCLVVLCFPFACVLVCLSACLSKGFGLEAPHLPVFPNMHNMLQHMWAQIVLELIALLGAGHGEVLLTESMRC